MDFNQSIAVEAYAFVGVHGPSGLSLSSLAFFIEHASLASMAHFAYAGPGERSKVVQCVLKVIYTNTEDIVILNAKGEAAKPSADRCQSHAEEMPTNLDDLWIAPTDDLRRRVLGFHGAPFVVNEATLTLLHLVCDSNGRGVKKFEAHQLMKGLDSALLSLESNLHLIESVRIIDEETHVCEERLFLTYLSYRQSYNRLHRANGHRWEVLTHQCMGMNPQFILQQKIKWALAALEILKGSTLPLNSCSIEVAKVKVPRFMCLEDVLPYAPIALQQRPHQMSLMILLFHDCVRMCYNARVTDTECLKAIRQAFGNQVSAVGVEVAQVTDEQWQRLQDACEAQFDDEEDNVACGRAKPVKGRYAVRLLCAFPDNQLLAKVAFTASLTPTKKISPSDSFFRQAGRTASQVVDGQSKVFTFDVRRPLPAQLVEAAAHLRPISKTGFVPEIKPGEKKLMAPRWWKPVQGYPRLIEVTVREEKSKFSEIQLNVPGREKAAPLRIPKTVRVHCKRPRSTRFTDSATWDEEVGDEEAADSNEDFWLSEYYCNIDNSEESVAPDLQLTQPTTYVLGGTECVDSAFSETNVDNVRAFLQAAKFTCNNQTSTLESEALGSKQPFVPFQESKSQELRTWLTNASSPICTEEVRVTLQTNNQLSVANHVLSFIRRRWGKSVDSDGDENVASRGVCISNKFAIVERVHSSKTENVAHEQPDESNQLSSSSTADSRATSEGGGQIFVDEKIRCLGYEEANHSDQGGELPTNVNEVALPVASHKRLSKPARKKVAATIVKQKEQNRIVPSKQTQKLGRPELSQRLRSKTTGIVGKAKTHINRPASSVAKSILLALQRSVASELSQSSKAHELFLSTLKGCHSQGAAQWSDAITSIQFVCANNVRAFETNVADAAKPHEELAALRSLAVRSHLAPTAETLLLGDVGKGSLKYSDIYQPPTSATLPPRKSEQVESAEELMRMIVFSDDSHYDASDSRASQLALPKQTRIEARDNLKFLSKSVKIADRSRLIGGYGGRKMPPAALPSEYGVDVFVDDDDDQLGRTGRKVTRQAAHALSNFVLQTSTTDTLFDAFELPDAIHGPLYPTAAQSHQSWPPCEKVNDEALPGCDFGVCITTLPSACTSPPSPLGNDGVVSIDSHHSPADDNERATTKREASTHEAAKELFRSGLSVSCNKALFQNSEAMPSLFLPSNEPGFSAFRHFDGEPNHFVFNACVAKVFDLVLGRPGITHAAMLCQIQEDTLGLFTDWHVSEAVKYLTKGKYISPTTAHSVPFASSQFSREIIDDLSVSSQDLTSYSPCTEGGKPYPLF